MVKVLRRIGAVFRYYPDPKGDIRMIHNGVNRLEIDETVEGLWFAIDNHTGKEELFVKFAALTDVAPSEQLKQTFETILEHFENAGFIEVQHVE